MLRGCRQLHGIAQRPTVCFCVLADMHALTGWSQKGKAKTEAIRKDFLSREFGKELQKAPEGQCCTFWKYDLYFPPTADPGDHQDQLGMQPPYTLTLTVDMPHAHLPTPHTLIYIFHTSHMLMHVFTHTHHVHACSHTYIHTHIHMLIHIHTHTYIRTHIHPYSNTQTQHGA